MDRDDDFRAALSWLKKRHRLTISDLAEAAECSTRHIQGVLSEAEKKGAGKEVSYKLALLFGCSYDAMLSLGRWILDGKDPSSWQPPTTSTLRASMPAFHGGLTAKSDIVGTMPVITWEKPEDLPNNKYVFVPRYDISVSAGNGHSVECELVKDQPQAFRSEWVKQQRLSRDLVCVTAHGDSMEPTIFNGDTLLVDRGSREVTPGRVYVIRYGNEIRVKRLSRRYDGALIVRSDNAAKYPEEIVPPEVLGEHVEIIGKVVWKGGEM